MNKQSIAMATGLNDAPEDILKKISLGGNCQAYYDAMRGWQIATVFNGKNYLVDCVEEQSKVLIYQ
tara:strand:- start:4787 stop:4984 length:198 start_codon:yes stop_codon:yes gene_type:complete